MSDSFQPDSHGDSFQPDAPTSAVGDFAGGLLSKLNPVNMVKGVVDTAKAAYENPIDTALSVLAHPYLALKRAKDAMEAGKPEEAAAHIHSALNPAGFMTEDSQVKMATPGKRAEGFGELLGTGLASYLGAKLPDVAGATLDTAKKGVGITARAGQGLDELADTLSQSPNLMEKLTGRALKLIPGKKVAGDVAEHIYDQGNAAALADIPQRAVPPAIPGPKSPYFTGGSTPGVNAPPALPNQPVTAPPPVVQTSTNPLPAPPPPPAQPYFAGGITSNAPPSTAAPVANAGPAPSGTLNFLPKAETPAPVQPVAAAVEAPAAAPVAAAADLDEIARSLGGKSFAKIGPAAQETVKMLAEKMKAQSAQVVQMPSPVNTAAVPVQAPAEAAHPPFAPDQPFSPSRAARQQTGAGTMAENSPVQITDQIAKLKRAFPWESDQQIAQRIQALKPVNPRVAELSRKLIEEMTKGK